MQEDIKTQQDAFIIARQYNLVPYDPVKCERTIAEGTVRTLFFANTSNVVKILIKYNRDELEPPE